MGEHWIVYGEPAAERPTLHPRHGIHDPVAGTPPRRPGSIRRTSTTDSLRPRGVNGPLVLRGRARDLLTPRSGDAAVLATASLDAEVAFMSERIVRSITTDPPIAGVEALVGTRASSGFRGAAQLAAAADHDERTLLSLLLDDVPVATLVSGFAVQFAGVRPVSDGRHHVQHPDLCAGWRTGGTILEEIDRTGFAPVVTGPDAPSILVSDDPLAWHELAPLGPNAMRRHRRLDLVAGEALGDALELDVFFRDSHVAFEGRETIIHEYSVRGTLDPGSLRFVEVEASAGSLPWSECIGAVDSARRLVGASATTLRHDVREGFVGATTCTHLNDTLRSLEDVVALAPLLATSIGEQQP
ncbi:MAG: DUF2889 domain-containing protein [Ilumatobacteraceae bacterium]